MDEKKKKSTVRELECALKQIRTIAEGLERVNRLGACPKSAILSAIMIADELEKQLGQAMLEAIVSSSHLEEENGGD